MSWGKIDFPTDKDSVSQTEGVREVLPDSRGHSRYKWNNSGPIISKTLKEIHCKMAFLNYTSKDKRKQDKVHTTE